MILKNLLRRKIRTSLTIFGVAIGVTAIIGLGAMANGLKIGYSQMLSGSKADLVISQPNAYDISFSSVKEEIGVQIAAMPEVARLSPMLQGFTSGEGQPYLYVFGYPPDSFILERFQIVRGVGLSSRQARPTHGKPILIGSALAEVLGKEPGDSLRLVNSVFRVVGIYQTGDAFEDSGVVLNLEDAQELLAKSREVSLFYVQLKNPSLRERFISRVRRQFPDLEISGIEEFASKQYFDDALQGYVWVIGGLAVILGGVGMMNAQMMSVYERTREIGVLRAVGWSSRRVLWMILSESVLICLLGGIFGSGLGYLAVSAITKKTVAFGVNLSGITPNLLAQAFTVVLLLGLTGGLYPAWRAARLQPVEALRYEGGGASKVRRLPLGGMAWQNLWQRTTRTLLTLGVISITVGAIVALEVMISAIAEDMSQIFGGARAEIMIRQAGVGDTGFSYIDERIGEKIIAMPGVQSVSGILFTAVMQPENRGFLVLWGLDPNDFFIQRYHVVEGKPLTTNHQILLGRMMAEALQKKVGDTLDVSGVRFRIVGIFESTVAWEELGGIVTLRDLQAFVGRPRKVSMFAVKVNEPSQAAAIVERINTQFPEVYAALSGEFVEQMPDFQSTDILINGISLLAILVGGIGVLNTMLMSVFERTREIGVLRALGWSQRRILGMVLNEALLLGILGGVGGVVTAFALVYLSQQAPMMGSFFSAHWEWTAFARAIVVAILLGLIGGLYPAYRATRLQPVEALRYE